MEVWLEPEFASFRAKPIAGNCDPALVERLNGKYKRHGDLILASSSIV